MDLPKGKNLSPDQHEMLADGIKSLEWNFSSGCKPVKAILPPALPLAEQGAVGFGSTFGPLPGFTAPGAAYGSFPSGGAASSASGMWSGPMFGMPGAAASSASGMMPGAMGSAAPSADMPGACRADPVPRAAAQPPPPLTTGCNVVTEDGWAKLAMVLGIVEGQDKAGLASKRMCSSVLPQQYP